MRYILVMALALLCAHCAPDNAHEIRELKPTSLGLLGGMYRPQGDQAFGITGGASNADISVSPSGWNRDDDKERDPKQTASMDLNVFYHHYPWQTSAFFVGAGVGYQAREYKWKERTNLYTSAVEDYTNVRYKDTATYLRVPLGWAWIWNSGFTLMLDLGPDIRVAQNKSYADSGKNVNEKRRDDYRDKLESKVVSFGGSGLIGWSF